MADLLTYTNIFDRLTPLIKWFNELETRQISVAATNQPLPYIRNQILVPFNTQGRLNEIATLSKEVDQLVNRYTLFKIQLITWAGNVLKQVGKDLSSSTTNPTIIAQQLREAMLKDYDVTWLATGSPGPIILQRVMTITDVIGDGSITAHTDNTGDGRLVHSFTEPNLLTQAGGFETSETAFEETIAVECSHAATAGGEVFNISGSTANAAQSPNGQGSGKATSISVLENAFLNSGFENWTSNIPNNWTLAAGTGGTDFEQDATNVLKDASCLQSNTSGNWQLTHAIPGTIRAQTNYLCGFWAKKDAGATGSLIIEITDVNGAAVTGMVTYTLDLSTLAVGSYAFKYIVIPFGAQAISTWRISMRTVSNAVASVYIDAFQFGAMSRHNGIWWGLCAGATDFALTDKFGFGEDFLGVRVIESSLGIFQKFFARVWGVQLPSGSAASTGLGDPT